MMEPSFSKEEDVIWDDEYDETASTQRLTLSGD
jgi:hypothetical protein